MSIIKGKSVTLRPFTKNDIDKTVIWKNNPLLQTNTMAFRLPVSSVMEESWLENAMSDSMKSVYLAIFDNVSKELIGYVNLDKIDWFSRVAAFGIVIGNTSHHRKGKGEEATRLFLGYAFHTLNIRKIYLDVIASNTPAVALYEKIGFTKEGLLKEHHFAEGAYKDVLYMSLFATDFQHQ